MNGATNVLLLILNVPLIGLRVRQLKVPYGIIWTIRSKPIEPEDK